MLAIAVILSLLGVSAFVFLFARDFNIYWLILSPVIFSIYQFPAVLVFWLYKRKKNRTRSPGPS
jgi:hypothetical protein